MVPWCTIHLWNMYITMASCMEWTPEEFTIGNDFLFTSSHPRKWKFRVFLGASFKMLPVQPTAPPILVLTAIPQVSIFKNKDLTFLERAEEPFPLASFWTLNVIKETYSKRKLWSGKFLWGFKISPQLSLARFTRGVPPPKKTSVTSKAFSRRT